MLVAIMSPKQLSIVAECSPGRLEGFRVWAAVFINTAIQLALHDPSHPTKVGPFGIYGAGLWTGHPIGLVIVSNLFFHGIRRITGDTACFSRSLFLSEPAANSFMCFATERAWLIQRNCATPDFSQPDVFVLGPDSCPTMARHCRFWLSDKAVEIRRLANGGAVDGRLSDEIETSPTFDCRCDHVCAACGVKHERIVCQPLMPNLRFQLLNKTSRK